MKNIIILNKKKYTFSDSTLKSIYYCIIENEKRSEEDRLYVMSLGSNSIVQKTYEELDYHEFILGPTYRVSELLGNIFNVFTQDKSKAYAQKLTDYFGETINWASTDYFNSLSATDATELAKSVFSTEELEKFKLLLSLMHLYHCADEDYQQTLEDYDDYADVIFVNGIGVKRIESGDKIILKPLFALYDAPIQQYKEFSGVLVPPYIRAAVFKTEHDIAFTEDDLICENASLFFFKLEQLTGKKFPIYRS